LARPKQVTGLASLISPTILHLKLYAISTYTNKIYTPSFLTSSFSHLSPSQHISHVLEQRLEGRRDEGAEGALLIWMGVGGSCLGGHLVGRLRMDGVVVIVDRRRGREDILKSE
jgi:hypothetical protein